MKIEFCCEDMKNIFLGFGKIFEAVDTFNYCPYCGKEMNIECELKSDDNDKTRDT